MGQSPALRQKVYRAKHWDKFHIPCSNCNQSRYRNSKLCKKCDVILNRTGEKSPYWKGGYENHKAHNRLSDARRKSLEGSHTEEEWLVLKEKYGFMCLCCKEVEPTVKLQEDHIIPITKDGCTDYITNIQPLCGLCNSRKYNKIINFIELHEMDKAGGLS